MQQGDFSTFLECSRDEELTYFLKLGRNVIADIQDIEGFSDEELNDQIEEIKMLFKLKRYEKFDYADSISQCAYVKKWWTLGAGLARHRILNAVRNNEELRRKITSPETPDIRIISLGSGPGCDVIGLCSALYDIYTDTGAYKNIKITLIDSEESWEDVFGIAKQEMRRGNYGKASRLFQNALVHTSYFQAHLPADPNDHIEYFSALKEADIVLIRGLFSILPFPDKPKVSEEIVNGIKVGAMVLYIDSPFQQFPGLELIYPKNEEAFNDTDYYSFMNREAENINTFSKGRIAVFVKRNK